MMIPFISFMLISLLLPGMFSVKTRKEAKRIEITDSLSEARVKVGELQKIVRDQTASKDEYALMLSEQSKGNIFYSID